MALVTLAPILNGWQGLTSTGLPLNGGFIYTYQAGTSTPLATYTTSAGSTPNANPIVLGSDGRPPQEIWMLSANAYKFVVADSLNNILATYDNIVPGLSSANNLSDVANATTALNNLGGLTNATLASNLQLQTLTTFTTAGTSTAYTLTPSPALGALTTNHRFNITFNQASGLNPTLAISGLTAKNLKVYDASGTKIPAVIPSVFTSDVQYDGTDYVILDPVPASSAKIQPFTATTASNILTGAFAASTLDYRNATATIGTPVTLSNTALTLAIPATSNLGMAATAQTNRLYWLVVNNAGTPVLCVVNSAGGNDLSETGFISPTTIGASSNTANVIYSASAVGANLAYRVIGFTDVVFTTGTGWSNPTLVQGMGGQALTAMSSFGFGQTYQDVHASRSFSTTYYNLTSKAIDVSISATLASIAQLGVNLIQNGVTTVINGSQTGAINQVASISFRVLPFTSYYVFPGVGGVTPSTWIETR